MADEEPIKLKVGIDNQAYLESVSEMAEVTQQAFTTIATTAIERAEKRLYEYSQQQQNLTAIIEQNKQAMISASAAEVAALEKVNKAHEQEIFRIKEKQVAQEKFIEQARANSEQHKLAISLVSQERLIEIGLMQDSQKVQDAAAKASATAATAEKAAHDKLNNDLEQLLRKRVELGAVIDKNSKMIAELGGKESQVNAAQVASLEKINEKHRDELHQLSLKKSAIEEEIQVTTASSEAEAAAAREAATEKRVELQATKDQSEAVQDTTQSTNTGSEAIGNFARQAGSLIGVTSVFMAIKKAIDLVDDSLRLAGERAARAFDALKTFRDLGSDVYQQTKQLVDSMGITDTRGIASVQDAVGAMGVETGIAPETIVSSGAALAGPLRQAGINDPTSARWKGLVSNAAIFADKGMDAGAIADYTKYLLEKNPNLTGEQLNQELSNVRAAGGSTDRTNAILGAFQASRAEGEASGFSFEDMEKLSLHMMQGGVSPTVATDKVRSFLRAIDRMKGKSIEEKEGIIQKLAGPNQPTSIMQMLAGSMASGKLDQKALLNAIMQLPQDQLDNVAEAIGGPRGIVAMERGQGFQDLPLPTADGLTPSPQSPDARKAAEQFKANLDNSRRQPTETGEAEFQTDVDNQIQFFMAHPDLIPGGFDPKTMSSQLTDMVHARALLLTGGGTLEGTAAQMVLARQFIKAGEQMRDIKAGRLKVSPQTEVKLKTFMERVGTELGIYGATRTGAKLGWNKQWAADMIQGSQTDHIGATGVDNFITNESGIDWSRISGGENISKGALQAGPQRTGDFEDVEKEIRSDQQKPKPSTQPSGPVSMNTYNIRQTNYGYGFDSMSSPDNWGSRLS